MLRQVIRSGAAWPFFPPVSNFGYDSGAYLRDRGALRLVRELYAAGATEVAAQSAAVEYEFEKASGLTVVLPNDPGKRAALFVIEARVLREMGSPFEPAGEPLVRLVQ